MTQSFLHDVQVSLWLSLSRESELNSWHYRPSRQLPSSSLHLGHILGAHKHFFCFSGGMGELLSPDRISKEYALYQSSFEDTPWSRVQTRMPPATFGCEARYRTHEAEQKLPSFWLQHPRAVIVAASPCGESLNAVSLYSIAANSLSLSLSLELQHINSNNTSLTLCVRAHTHHSAHAYSMYAQCAYGLCVCKGASGILQLTEPVSTHTVKITTLQCVGVGGWVHVCVCVCVCVCV